VKWTLHKSNLRPSHHPVNYKLDDEKTWNKASIIPHTQPPEDANQLYLHIRSGRVAEADIVELNGTLRLLRDSALIWGGINGGLLHGVGGGVGRRGQDRGRVTRLCSLCQWCHRVHLLLPELWPHVPSWDRTAPHRRHQPEWQRTPAHHEKVQTKEKPIVGIEGPDWPNLRDVFKFLAAELTVSTSPAWANCWETR